MFDTTSSPQVSIIMPTYNRAGLIMQTIESIRQQTYLNWELIIVDDGSEDNTEDLIAQLKDDRIQFHKAGRTGIGGKNKNIGLGMAKGELTAFIDSDDLWLSTKLEKQVEALRQYPEAGFCLTNGYNFREAGQPIDYFYREREGVKYDNIFIDLFQSKVAGFTQALLFRNECLYYTGPFKEEKSFSDLEFIISLASHFKAVILFEPLVFRRLHDSNYITPNWEKSYYEGIEIIKSNRDKLPSAIAKNALFRTYMNFGEKYLQFRQRKKAANKFLKGWQYKPLSIVPLKKTAKAMLHYLRGK
jgi:glycosyltransferase involved in cell wall biosynthesis